MLLGLLIYRLPVKTGVKIKSIAATNAKMTNHDLLLFVIRFTALYDNELRRGFRVFTS